MRPLEDALVVVYESKYGQTQKIAEHVARVAERRGYGARLLSVADVTGETLDGAAGYAVLAPVYGGRHLAATLRFLERHGDALNTRPSVFFSISGSAGSTVPAQREHARTVATEVVEKTPWRPNLIRTAGGAMAFPRYNPFLRFFMRLMAKRAGHSTDTSRIHELTDWRAVEHTVHEWLDLVERPGAIAEQREMVARL